MMKNTMSKLLFMLVGIFGIVMLFSDISIAATGLPQYDLTTTSQTLDASDRIQMNFTMKKTGYVTIKCDGSATFSLYNSNETAIIEEELLTESTDYCITYPLNAGAYYITLDSRNAKANYYVTVSAAFEYKTPALSKKKKTYYGRRDVPYYTKLTVKKAGYVVIDTTISQSYDPPTIYVCNSKKKAITQGIASDEEYGKGQYAFAVKKGTYYIKAVPKYDAKYTLKYKFKACSDKKGKALKGGTSKKKAKTIKIGKSASGLILPADKTSKKHWYKIVSSTPRYITLKISGNVSSSATSVGGQKFTYSIKGPYTQVSSWMNGAGYSDTYTFGVGPEPTYICITKVGKKTSGNYKITVKK